MKGEPAEGSEKREGASRAQKQLLSRPGALPRDEIYNAIVNMFSPSIHRSPVCRWALWGKAAGMLGVYSKEGARALLTRLLCKVFAPPSPHALTKLWTSSDQALCKLGATLRGYRPCMGDGRALAGSGGALWGLVYAKNNALVA